MKLQCVQISLIIYFQKSRTKKPGAEICAENHKTQLAQFLCLY